MGTRVEESEVILGVRGILPMTIAPFSPPGLRVCSSSLPYFHKCPQVRMLLLAVFCVGISVVWGIFRNEDQ